MSVINTDAEKEKLSCMYDGDKSRDASGSIRGFLFQDFVTISRLLEENVEYVCSEYLEDVDVFFEDDRFEFIQVKYYPQTTPDMEEISTDLYYQYLRLRMLDSGLKARPLLYIHRDRPVEKPELEDMKLYMGFQNESKKRKAKTSDPQEVLPATANYPADPKAWLKETVHKEKKKQQKELLFRRAAAEDTLRDFLDVFVIAKQKSIEEYKAELMDALGRAYPNPDKRRKKDHWQRILLGLAITYIQRRYSLDKPDFEQLRVVKKDFEQHMKDTAGMKPELTIAGYLVSVVAEEYERIIKHNKLSDLQLDMLDRIYQKTVQWIAETGATADGQYQLLNTISTDEASEIADYSELDEADQLRCMAACKRDFHIFLKYLWKIMLNICQEKVDDRKKLDHHRELFDPKHYIDPSVMDYVCLNFPEDRYINHSVILPQAAGEFRGVKRRITDRMVNMQQKPEKWFFANNALKRGKNYYSYSTADINEDPAITDLGEDTFYIECMECIRIDEGDWCEREACGACIFSMKCVKEETSL